MEPNITYFSRAEDDYLFLKFAYENQRVDTAMSYIAQSICERYLKHILDVYCRDLDLSSILRTHSLRNLSKFFRRHLPDFTCDWHIVLQCDGYYFSARYPGDDAIEIDAEDIENCWQAVCETRKSVQNYLLLKDDKHIETAISQNILDHLKDF